MHKTSNEANNLQAPAHLDSADAHPASRGERAGAVILLAVFTAVALLIAVNFSSLASWTVSISWAGFAWLLLATALWPRRSRAHGESTAVADRD